MDKAFDSKIVHIEFTSQFGRGVFWRSYHMNYSMKTLIAKIGELTKPNVLCCASDK